MSDREAIFKLWCEWNAKEIVATTFTFIALDNPIEFRKTYWNLGLKKYWQKWLKEGVCR